MLKNWQETACTVTNTADNKHIHLFGRIIRKEYKQGDGTLQQTFESLLFPSY